MIDRNSDRLDSEWLPGRAARQPLHNQPASPCGQLEWLDDREQVHGGAGEGGMMLDAVRSLTTSGLRMRFLSAPAALPQLPIPFPLRPPSSRLELGTPARPPFRLRPTVTLSMSSPRADHPSRIRPRGDGDQLRQPSSSSPAQSASANQSNESDAAPSVSACRAAAGQPADAQPQLEQVSQPTESRQSCLCRTPRALEQLAVVELQLMMQFLDTKGKLIAARCSRRLLQAADHAFAWQGSSAEVSSYDQPQLGSLIRQSLLRHASITLTLKSRSDLPTAEVAAIPRLSELILSHRCSADLALHLLQLPSLQGLQTLRVATLFPESALQLLPTLPAIHTLQCSELDDLADWSWLPAMPALTDLDLQRRDKGSLSLSLLDAIGRCARLRSLRLRRPRFNAGGFARLCLTPALRQLRHLTLDDVSTVDNTASEEFTAEALSALACLESLHLMAVPGVDWLLLHLAHAPALRTLTFVCTPDEPIMGLLYGSTHPSFRMLRWLLTAAPRLEVRLGIPASMDGWLGSDGYRRLAATESDRKEMDDQWRELQCMGAELERVTVVSG